MPTDKTVRAALYLRVSTTDKGQETDNQLLQLREFCDRAGWIVTDTYIDRESGSKGKRQRSDFARLFSDAASRQFDVVLFWSLDRFTREGITKTLNYLQQLNGYGVKFKSYTEPMLDTDNELVSHIVLTVISYFAQQEAVKISRRTKAGLERAKAQGKTLGRPSKYQYWKPKLIEMRLQNCSQGEMSRRTGLSYNTVKSYLKKIDSQ